MKRTLYAGAAFIGVIGALGIGSAVLDKRAQAATITAPRRLADSA